ncbi:MAG: fructose-6-phosphate aldolase [Bacteroidota bacterium]
MPTFYLLKVKGKAKIPDYIQLRDEQLTLIGYFRPGRKERLLKVVKNENYAMQIQSTIDSLEEYGKMTKVIVEEENPSD